MTTLNQEDYLRVMFCLSEQGNREIKSIDIVKNLQISKSAVSTMLKRLKESGDIKMKPYSNIIFTPEGFEKAKMIVYKHRISEVFLRDVLKLQEDILHEEANKLEHGISDLVAEKIYNFLGRPELCPCGNKIPNISC